MKSNVVKMSCKRGFTLIELLVVVLIIGVLAAVALPQYNKAVKKAQGAEVLNAIDAMDKALASFYQTYGKYEDPTSTGIIHREFLDVDLPDLKYWDYANNGYGNDSDAPTGSSCIQIGSNGQGIFLSNPRGTRVNVLWENGHLLYGLCYGDECGEYFNCNWTERISYPCPGPQWCSAEIVRECYLNL